MPSQYSPAFAARFWAKVNRAADPAACWEWRAYRLPKGYGLVWNGERPAVASRVSWEMANGPIPPGMMACHRCDNPPCVNPAHLFLGDAKVNLSDMARKGRSTKGDRNPSRLYPERVARGERNGSARLDWEKVRAIRAAAVGGARGVDLARRYGMSQAAVSLLLAGKTWAEP